MGEFEGVTAEFFQNEATEVADEPVISEKNKPGQSEVSLQESKESLDAVANAMMIALYHLSLPFIREAYEKGANNNQLRRLDLSRLVEKDSQYKCLVSSEEALAYLATRHSDKFKKLFIITSKKNVPAFVVNWSEHAYFIAEDKDGKWFAGSPANYSRSETNSQATNILQANSLNEILEKITEASGGYWSTENEIFDKMKDEDYIYPTLIEKNTEDNQSNYADKLEQYTKVEVDFQGVSSSIVRSHRNS